MNFKIATLEQIKSIYPGNYNLEILKLYGLADNDLNTTFCYYYSFYRYILENYLLQKIDLTGLNNKVEQMDISASYSDPLVSISNLNLNRVYIKNNVFLDRLNYIELEELKNLFLQKDHNASYAFIEKTYQKLIMFNDKEQADKIINYDQKDNLLSALNGSLVIGVIASASASLISYLKQKEHEFSSILGIPVNILVLNKNMKSDDQMIQIKSEESNNPSYSRYLPLGSIVYLKEGKKRIMITGYSQINMDKQQDIYDYLGCLYPEGVVNTELNILFNHQDIETICAIGLIDEEQKKFNDILQELNN